MKMVETTPVCLRGGDERGGEEEVDRCGGVWWCVN